ncbi:Clr5 domain-containing protein [Echria macrotheca]|uniref:Clr5 domain-containing protein n=1 Tax=Echria macrotheca TaxID=438768 RepID=A0AAJ0F7I1_9PEZI|nr:Clr5 domain-containing protein [Echria macrotheca]
MQSSGQPLGCIPHWSQSEPPSRRIVTPTRQSDWETVKDIIEDLYIRKNVRLKDVMDVLQRVYHFRATARMYKAQFVRWNWHKYATSQALGNNSTRGSRKGRKGTPRLLLTDNRRSDHRPRNVLQTQLLEVHQHRYLTVAVCAFRDFILGWAEKDPRWNSGAASPFARMGSYNSTMISHFVGALLQFQQDETQEGGRLLRAAFLGLEDLVVDGHMAAVWDCCVAVPLLTATHKKPHLLQAFLRHLSQLCATKAPDHPLRRICPAVLGFAENATSPQCMAEYTSAVWRLWSDTLASLLGSRRNISLLHTHRAYLIIQPTPDPALVRHMADEYNQLVADASASLGPDTTTALALEFDALLTLSRFNVVHPTALESRLARVLDRLARKEGNFGVPPRAWSLEDRQVLRGCWFLATLYAEAAGDAQRAAECRAAFLATPPDGDWVQYALRMEERLKAAGKVEEAEEVRRKRMEVQLPRDIVEILDEEEREAVQAGV